MKKYLFLNSASMVIYLSSSSELSSEYFKLDFRIWIITLFLKMILSYIFWFLNYRPRTLTKYDLAVCPAISHDMKSRLNEVSQFLRNLRNAIRNYLFYNGLLTRKYRHNPTSFGCNWSPKLWTEAVIRLSKLVLNN